MSQGLSKINVVNNIYIGGAFLSLSGGTVSGDTIFTQNLSALTLNSQAILSAGTNLYDIFLSQQSGSSSNGSAVTNGINTYTAGTFALTSVNVTGGTVNNWNVTGGTLSSGGTDLYSIFITTDDGNDITRVQPGSNITTGGTGNLPIINLVANPSLNNIISSGLSQLNSVTSTSVSGTSISGGTIILPDLSAPSAPPSGWLKISSFNQQGFSVLHQFDTQGNAIELTRDCVTIVRNTTGGALSKGQVVIVTGSTGTVPTIALALASSTTYLPAAGVLYENISNNSFGRMIIIGNLESINLSAFTSGDLLYVSSSTPGGLTNVKPTYPNYAQSIGTVLNNGVGNGVLQIFTRVVQGISNNDSSATVNTLSASTFISGSTNLYSVFQPIGNLSANVNGINTYTAGTFNLQSINISAATLDNIIVSGAASFNTVIAFSESASTISATTFYGDATNLTGMYWKTVPGNPTLVNGSSFTITDINGANNYVHVLGRGTVLKWTDTITRMAMVNSATYSASAVTLTLMGDILSGSATMSSMKFTREKAKPIVFSMPGTIAALNDASGRFYCPYATKIFGADVFHNQSGVTNSTAYQVSKNASDGTGTILSGAALIISTALSGIGFTASDSISAATYDYLTLNCISGSTTAAIDAYLNLHTFPFNNQFFI